MISENSIIHDGDYTILQKVGGEQLRPCRLLNGQRALIEKLSFDPKDAFGKPYGVFEVGSNGKTLDTVDFSKETYQPIPDESILMQNGNNTMESFKERSHFSKEKYLRKMTKKHSVKVMISRPTIRLLCLSYFNKDPERLAHLRFGQLSLLLQLLNIHSCGCNVFVYENTLGLLGAAVMERLDNQGNCIFLHRGDWPQSIPCIDAMNNYCRDNFLPLRITTFLQPDILKNEEESDQLKIQRRQSHSQEIQDDGKNISTIDVGNLNESDSSLQSLLERRAERRKKEKRALDVLLKNSTEGNEVLNEGKLDGILLAGRTFDTVDVLKQVIDGLRLSGSVVVYSPIKQHILKAWNFLRSTNSFIDMQIQEQFCRTYQILPNQTHPLMQQPVI
uniref:tRNA (adenine(58)-N(1))-methyltransferase non-catalytic subunit TRM6 n=1 Tax=Meloidogyne hapla TaxID=6305 RepID=A0A1I8BG24_MELHA